MSQALELNGNYVSGMIPSELGLLTQLTDLLLQDTRISGIIPPTFGALSNIRRLWLSSTSPDGQTLQGANASGQCLTPP